jgi:RHS repeat-associated protein
VRSIANNRDSTRNQTFTYDSLNRIATGYTAATSGAMCWGKNFNIDQWSNLYSTTALAGYSNCSQTQISLSINSNNRASGYGYDLAGDMTYDGLYHYLYDAESRVCSIGGTTCANGAVYSYDGDGQRAEKSTGTLYWYGLGGQVLSETALNGGNPVDYIYFNGSRLARVASSGTLYYFQDNLSSTRVNVQAGQSSACFDADFEPYGMEHDAITPTCTQNYKFTGKERDSESGLDNFGARYNSSSLGRFMSPDPLGGSLVDPQTLNKYSYVRNNSETLTDPTGLYTCADDQNKCQSKQDIAFERARQQDLQSKDSDVVRAAKAYGDPTKDNGVNVGFADLSKKNEAGDTTSTLGADANGNLRANSNVLIDTNTVNSGGSALDAAVGHEGSHVGDAQDLVNSITITDLAKGTFTVGQDITQYASEQRAYHVSDSILRSENTHETFQCGIATCQLGNTVLRGQVTSIIDQILRANYKSAINNQPLTEKNPGASVVPH